MKSKKKIEGIFLDFDGVISKVSVENTVKFVYEFINEIAPPMSLDFIRDYMKKVLCFSPQPSIELLFYSLGIQKYLKRFYKSLHNLDTDVSKIEIEKEFYHFIDFCHQKQINYKILSLASPHRIKLIKNFDFTHIYSLNGLSKSDPKTFQKIKKDLKIVFKDWVYVDDSPIALRTGKMTGLLTIMKLNNIYDESEYRQFASSIDYKIHTFLELETILSE